MEVDVQWALYGKRADSDGYHVLACSTGPMSRANFAEAISRFQVGVVERLPQVSVSYARLNGEPGVDYLALAIDEFAPDGQWTEHDRDGRRITYTSYFCLPYKLLAELAIGYLGTYQALQAVRLPDIDGPPLRMTLAAPAARVLAVDPLAMRVAALLLTGRPVCVLGADATTVGERLHFVDAVMALLPYGLRARMAAATWTRATQASHRFRLYFSSAERLGDQPDHVVVWGEPDQTTVPSGPPADYLGWLEDTIRPIVQLADLNSTMGFSSKDAAQVVERALSSRQPPSSPAQPDPGE
jgi:hypothetical protein